MKMFLDYVSKELGSNDITLELSKNEEVFTKEGTPCNGFFSPQEKKLVVAIGNKAHPTWLAILVHEFCHFLQYKDQTQIWKNFIKVKDQGYSLNSWLQGSDYDLSTLIRIFSTTIELEWDCEERSISLIEQFDIPVDLISYTKGANAYLYSYSWIYKHRKWIGGKHAPYYSGTITEAMPENLQKDYLNMENDFLKLFDTVYS